MVLRFILVITAALLLGAHFLREGSLLAVTLCLAAPLLLLWRRPWVPVVLQIMAYGASASWIITTLAIIEQRHTVGRDWTVAGVILGAAALLTLLAGLLLNSRSFRARYSR